MAELTDEELFTEITYVKLNPAFENVVFVQYRDHVMYNRASALMMQPQTREAVGWLIYENETYIIISWDRDAGPPTLHGNDAKASGLVLLKSDILNWAKFYPEPSKKHSNCHLNSSQPIVKDEYALRPTERKTQNIRKGAKAA
jgi:hypothetical protein